MRPGRFKVPFILFEGLSVRVVNIPSNFGCTFLVGQQDIVAFPSIAKVKDTTPLVEAVVLDAHLKGRGPAKLEVGDVDVLFIPVERDSVTGAHRVLKKTQHELEIEFPHLLPQNTQYSH